jgi:hypothetical protein
MPKTTKKTTTQLLTEEFALQGFPEVHEGRVRRLAAQLDAEDVEAGDIAIAYAVIGYLVAVGRK